MTRLITQVASESPHGARAIKVLSAAVGVSRASFYRHRQRPAPALVPKQAETKLRQTIECIALEMPSYGYRPMTAELHRRGLVVNRKHVLRLMRQDNLLCRRRARESLERTTHRRDHTPASRPCSSSAAPFHRVM